MYICRFPVPDVRAAKRREDNQRAADRAQDEPPAVLQKRPNQQQQLFQWLQGKAKGFGIPILAIQ